MYLGWCTLLGVKYRIYLVFFCNIIEKINSKLLFFSKRCISREKQPESNTVYCDSGVRKSCLKMVKSLEEYKCMYSDKWCIDVRERIINQCFNWRQDLLQISRFI